MKPWLPGVIASLLIAVIGAVLMAAWHGPDWACFGTGWLTYFAVINANASRRP